MPTFTYLDKKEKDIWLPKLFDILYSNMKSIAPSSLTYDEEKNIWLSNVSPAIDKSPREIILCFDDDTLAGFMQYYVNGEKLVIEEVQLTDKYQRTTAFYRMCKYLCKNLPETISSIEAYADKRNSNSIAMMNKLGMKSEEAAEASPYLQFKGTTEPFRKVLDK